MIQGKLIVFEGIDGSGKSTQYRLLLERFKREGIDCHSVIFPRYDKDSSALIRMYLGGEFGSSPMSVNPYAASTFFSVDRCASYLTDWGEDYRRGGLILADRYTTSNAVHQGSKMDESDVPAYFDWLYDFEYGRLGLPRPDMVVYLEVDIDTALARLRHRQQKTNTQADIHESDREYLLRCIRTGELAADHYGWTRVALRRDGAVRSREEKHEEIFSLVKAKLAGE